MRRRKKWEEKAGKETHAEFPKDPSSSIARNPAVIYVFRYMRKYTLFEGDRKIHKKTKLVELAI